MCHARRSQTARATFKAFMPNTRRAGAPLPLPQHVRDAFSPGHPITVLMDMSVGGDGLSGDGNISDDTHSSDSELPPTDSTDSVADANAPSGTEGSEGEDDELPPLESSEWMAPRPRSRPAHIPGNSATAQQMVSCSRPCPHPTLPGCLLPCAPVAAAAAGTCMR